VSSTADGEGEGEGDGEGDGDGDGDGDGERFGLLISYEPALITLYSSSPA